MDNITKQQAVEIMKKAFDLKDFNNREDGLGLADSYRKAERMLAGNEFRTGTIPYRQYDSSKYKSDNHAKN